MSLVGSFTHLRGRPRENEATALLQRIASLVKPIMRKHGWKLPVLAEFFPENESLVGPYIIIFQTTVPELLLPNRFEYVTVLSYHQWFH